MTATTEPTTAPEVPAWLNLDAIIAPELREEIAEATAELTDSRSRRHSRRAALSRDRLARRTDD